MLRIEINQTEKKEKVEREMRVYDEKIEGTLTKKAKTRNHKFIP